MKETDQRLLLLSPEDNILVLGASVDEGERLEIYGEAVTMPRHLVLGHKLARRDIAKGEVILKYGAPIGTATEDIPLGAHVHTHNIVSNYTKTHTLHDAQAEYGETT